MKTIPIEIPEGKKAEWVDGVLALVDDKPLTTVEGPKVEFKFKVGDKVKRINDSAITYTITGQFVVNGEPMYNLKVEWGETASAEKWLELAPQDITERIKTFIDAWAWCNENGKEALVDEYDAIIHSSVDSISHDILAYLKLRIITAALNEGWEPSGEDKERYTAAINIESDRADYYCEDVWAMASHKMAFKSKELALHAALQFHDIYADFCGKSTKNKQ